MKPKKHPVKRNIAAKVIENQVPKQEEVLHQNQVPKQEESPLQNQVQNQNMDLHQNIVQKPVEGLHPNQNLAQNMDLHPNQVPEQEEDRHLNQVQNIDPHQNPKKDITLYFKIIMGFKLIETINNLKNTQKREKEGDEADY